MRKNRMDKHPRQNSHYTEKYEVAVAKPNRRRNEEAEQERLNQLAQQEYELQSAPEKVIPPLRALTQIQGEYIAAQRTADIVIGAGVAGTGKSFVAIALACEQLQNHEVENIYIVRPLVESGRQLGALPGELDAKISPYFLPVIAILEERLGKRNLALYLKRGQIKFLPLELLRGSSFNSCVVILDEAQNVTAAQMLMFLTRMGKDCRIVINGDDQQLDLRGTNALSDAIKRLEHIDGVRVVRFEIDDIVRNSLIKSIILAYRGV